MNQITLLIALVVLFAYKPVFAACLSECEKSQVAQLEAVKSAKNKKLLKTLAVQSNNTLALLGSDQSIEITKKNQDAEQDGKIKSDVFCKVFWDNSLFTLTFADELKCIKAEERKNQAHITQVMEYWF